MSPKLSFLAVAAASVLVACGFGQSSLSGTPGARAERRQVSSSASPSPSASPTATPTPHRGHGGIQYAISGLDAVGSKVKAALDAVDESAHRGPGSSRTARLHGCKDRVEFFSPDRQGEPQSTETIDFYDAGCTLVERDSIRWYRTTSVSSEILRGKLSFYDRSGALTAVRTKSSRISHATFMRDGYPDLFHGFVRDSKGSLVVTGRKNASRWASEFLVETTATTALYDFCDALAGYEDADDASAPAYGWQGGTADSTSTIADNGDGTVTYSTTHEGKTEEAAHGALGISEGTPNPACPIVTPAYQLTGGDTIAQYTIPFVATFDIFHLRSLRIHDATLGAGWTLDTSSSRASRVLRIDGAIDRNGERAATFAIDRLGYGTLRFTSGARYPIVDWTVIR